MRQNCVLLISMDYKYIIMYNIVRKQYIKHYERNVYHIVTQM